MNYWQVAAGEGARDYSSVFLQFGIMLIGAGDPGPYFSNKEYYKGHRNWRAQVVRFAEKVTKGDIVVLKRDHINGSGKFGLWELSQVTMSTLSNSMMSRVGTSNIVAEWNGYARQKSRISPKKGKWYL